jgi:formylglycine-generating enzyme required for sulfatase activity
MCLVAALAIAAGVGYMVHGEQSPAPGGHGGPAAPVVATDGGVAGTSSNPVPPPPCPPDMVYIPGGSFSMGSPEGTGDDEEHPRHPVTLPPYCIDRNEVTVKAYAECVAAGACRSAERTVQSRVYSAEDVELFSRFCNADVPGDVRSRHPINCVSWERATAYCTWDRRRLPTEAEWEYAARGSDGRRYPWEGDIPPSAQRLNACGSECVATGKREGNRDWKAMYDASDHWDTTAPVGSFPAGASPFGALDMAGNVSEWTADSYARYQATGLQDPRDRGKRVIRGGSWYDSRPAYVTATVRSKQQPSDRSSYIGFRCACESAVGP